MDSARILLSRQFETPDKSTGLHVKKYENDFYVLLLVDGPYKDRASAEAVMRDLWEPMLSRALTEIGEAPGA